MAADSDLQALDDRLNALAALYQFRPLDDRTFGSLTVSQSYTLRVLFFGGDRSMGDLAAELGVRVSTMTGVVDQLQGKGLVERADRPHDRRSFRVRLTARGRTVYRRAHDAFMDLLRPLLRDRPAKSRTDILEFLDAIIQVVHGWRAQAGRRGRRGRANS